MDEEVHIMTVFIVNTLRISWKKVMAILNRKMKNESIFQWLNMRNTCETLDEK
jgi:hypothetical protein